MEIEDYKQQVDLNHFTSLCFNCLFCVLLVIIIIIDKKQDKFESGLYKLLINQYIRILINKTV